MKKLNFDKEAFKKHWIYLVGIVILFIPTEFIFYKILTLPKDMWSISDNLIFIFFVMVFAIITLFYSYDRERFYERIKKLEQKRK